MTTQLLGWLEDPATGAGIRFSSGDNWDFTSYDHLAAKVRGVAAALGEKNLRRGGVVSLAFFSSAEFVASFFGTLAGGGIPSPLPAPIPFQDPDDYERHVAAILRAAKPALILCDPKLADAMRRAVTMAQVQGTVIVLLLEDLAEQESPIAARADLALLQFTSGSTGTPRGVQISWDNLQWNIEVIKRWLRMTSDDATATWLPLYHDMGLIGCLLTPVVNQSDLWVLRPEQFVQRPLHWLECFGRFGASLTASPYFAFPYIASKVAPSELEGMDFSGWRGAPVGAERIDPAGLERFAQLLEPFGFRRQTLLPGYGLAEATLLVTGDSLETAPDLVRIEWTGLREGQPVEILEQARLGERDARAQQGWLVSSGPALDELDVRILDPEGRTLPDRCLGEIEVAGPSVAAGYIGGAGAGTSSWPGDRLRTGDAGFLFQGNLFVVGRMSESLKVRGRNVYAEDLEAQLAAVPGIRPGKCAVVLGCHHGVDRAFAIVEAETGDWVEPVARMLRRKLGEDVTIAVLVGPLGTIPRTSSGKPRRRVMWRALLDDELRATVVYQLDSQSDRVAASV